MSDDTQDLTITYDSEKEAWTIRKGNYYLNQSSDTAGSAGTTSSLNNTGNYWIIGKVTASKTQTVKFTVDPGSITMPRGNSYTIQPTVTVGGKETNDYDIEWSSSSRWVTVDSNGRVTAGNYGSSATITA